MNNEQKSEMVFCDGMSFKEAHEKAPESVRGSVYFHAGKFIAFLNAHKNERGYVNTKMMKSMRTGSIYFILDTYKADMSKPEGLLTDEEKQKISNTRDAHNSRSEEESMEDMASETPF